MRRRPSVSLLLVALSAPLGPGCAADAMVSIDLHTDLAPAEEFDEIVVSIDGVDVDSSGVGAAEYVVAGRRLGPFAVAAGVHQIEVSLESRGTPVLARGQRLSVSGHVVLPVWIMRTCVDVVCPSSSAPLATECQDGVCVEPACALPDPCADGCSSAADCTPPLARCAQVRCIESHCVAVALAGECTTLEYCDPELGCRPRTAPVDAGTADAGAADAGPSAMDAPVPDAPTGGCLTDADCPAPSYGSWSGCGGFSDACDDSGARDRVVTTHACSAGACVRSTSVENSGCSRDTSGASCGSDTTSVVSPCSYTDTCDASGSETLRTTRYACGGGTCRSSFSDSTGACSRSTAGVLCLTMGTCTYRCMAELCEPECRPGCPC